MTATTGTLPARPLAFGTLGAVLGLGGALVITAVAVVALGPEAPSERLGFLGLAAVFAGPFALALFARSRSGWLRAGVWVGAGILGLGMSFTSMTGVTLLLVPAALLLMFAGIREWKEGAGRLRPVLPMLAVVGIAAISFLAMFLLPTPGCWELHRAGTTMWWVNQPARPSIELRPGEELGRCSSDTVTLPEAGLSAGVWVLGASGLVLADRKGGRR